MLLTQTVLIFFVACLGYMNSFFGSSNLGRPLITATLVGLVLGDLKTGIMVGATLELVWLGAFPIGASNPPEMVSGSIIGTSYVILTGAEVASAVLLAVPVASLVQMVWDFLMMFAVPMLNAKADKYAEECNASGIDMMHYIAIIIQTIPLGLIVASGFYFGSPVIESVVNSIPQWLSSGLAYATGIIPAIGFAMIARMIMNKQLVSFLFIGFFLAAYLNVPIIGIVGLGCCIVAYLYFNSNKEEGGLVDDNEF